jgi:nucleotide-binding universal stress UspA family protein
MQRHIVFERVLVAHDGSDAAESGLNFAGELSRTCGSQVTVLYVVSRAEFERGIAETPTKGPPLSLEQADAWVDEVCRLHSVPGAPAMTPALTEHGRPATAVIERAEQLDADLVIVGKSGRHSLKRFLLGTVAERLIQYAPCSTAIFPEHVFAAASAPVIAAYDGSEPSQHALGLAASLASTLSAGLLIVHALDDIGVPPIPSALDLLREHAEEVLREAPARLVQPLESVQEELRVGDPRVALLEAADQYHPRMLVLGHRGEGGFVGLRIGSTAREVSAAASVPVLVARPRS